MNFTNPSCKEGSFPIIDGKISIPSRLPFNGKAKDMPLGKILIIVEFQNVMKQKTRVTAKFSISLAFRVEFIAGWVIS
jgi:hypothetical protein